MLLNFNGLYELQADHSMVKFRNLFEPVQDYKDNPELVEKIESVSNIGFKRHLADRNMAFYRGTIYNQAWRGRYSTEARLYIDKDAIINNDIIIYNGKEYESTNYFYNAILRTSAYFDNPWVGIGCMDNCGDCSIEGNIWNDYKTKFGQDPKKYLDKFNLIIKQDLCKKKFDTNKHGKLLFDKK